MEQFKNNHESMKTTVETFVIEETAELIYDDNQLTKWNELIGELGLEGQTKIVVGKKSPIPFLHLKKSMVAVFETLCPRKVDIKEYDVTPIPVEILELAALSEREGYFSSLQIWYDDKNPDPVCVGILYEHYVRDAISYRRVDNTPTFKHEKEAEKYIKENGLSGGVSKTNWEGEKYLLGKWADVKHSFAELKNMATNRYVAEEGNRFRKDIKEAQRGLDDLETKAFERFN
jgi:hypothetical protein